ncbi:MAG: P-loop NTPase fold protein [Bacteroidota bacterium]|nr:P-loop NTPase fold protein [Bacteroidota bacterium]MDP4257641.1 P-loop NTPase fold protein [Bacteroidota bacterium]
MPPEKKLNILYLKRIGKLASKNPSRSVQPYAAGKSLQLEDSTSTSIEGILKERGWIEESATLAGTIKITNEGTKALKDEIWWIKYPQKMKNTFRKLSALADFKKNLFHALILFLIYVVFESFIESKLNELWVNKILARFHPNAYFDFAFLVSSVVLIYKNCRRKIGTWDMFLIAIYVRYRSFTSFWHFWPLFMRQKWNDGYFLYIDFIGVYYIFTIFFSVKSFVASKISPQQVYKEGFLYPDLSLSRIAIQTDKSIFELDNTGLKRNKFARQISEIITQTQPFHAFAIGINAPWGSGKTSLIELIVANLKIHAESKKYLYIDFSPWYFSNPEMLITSFFSLLEDKFRHNKHLVSELKAYGKEITMAEKSLLKTEFTKLLFESSLTLKERRETIIKQIQQEGKVLIVSIDDLDRLDKKEIVDIFRLIRLVADFPNTFYIVGYDRNYINSAIEQELTKCSPEKYADKIFNVEFKIPELSTDIIKERTKMYLEKQIEILGEKVGKIDKVELSKCFDYSGLDRFIKNERNIKQFTNNLIMRYLSIKDEVNFYFFFLLELINYKDANLLSSLYYSRESILKKYRDLETGKSESDPIDFPTIIGRPIQSEIKDVLDELFQKSSYLKRYSISNDLYFVRYFSLSLLESDFSTAEFEDALNQPPDILKRRLVEYNTINSPLLTEKLHSKFNRVTISDKHELSKLIDSLLFLYNEVYHSKNSKALQEGLNANNLGKFIFDLILWANQSLSFLEERILASTVTDFAAFSYLFGVENIRVFESSGDIARRGEFFYFFREMQLKFLRLEIERSNNQSNDRIINQLQRLRSFASFDKNDPRGNEYIKWFWDHVLVGYSKFLAANADAIITYIKGLAIENGAFDLNRSKELVNSIFVDIESYQDVYIQNGLEKMVDFYLGFDVIKIIPFDFTDQTPPDANHPDCNDATLPDIFELKKGLFFQITLEPINTPYWRFGFRLSRNSEFPPVIQSRHIDDYPYIHLTKGQIDIEGNGTDDSPPTLDLGVYSGTTQEYVDRLLHNYQNNKIILYFYYNNETISIKVSDGSSSMASAKPITLFNDYKYLRISAWSDRRKFIISTRIKVLQQINPALSF